MLDQALLLIKNRLNEYLSQRFVLDEKIVMLGAPVSPDGVMPVEANDKILVFVTNINRDTLPGRNTPDHLSAAQTKAPLYLNLYVAVAANFRTKRYEESLEFLSTAIRCFQQSPVIDSSVVADMPSGIQKLLIDIENTSLAEESNLWGILGGRYLPSILYKVRMLTVNNESVSGHVPRVRQPDRGLGAS